MFRKAAASFVFSTRFDEVRTRCEPLIEQFKQHQRVISFGFIGVSVMILGFILLYTLVDILGMDENLAYFIQAVFSIELNFLLNHFFTWGDRRNESHAWQVFLSRWGKFHITRVVTALLSQIVFSLLIFFVHYLVANGICVVIAMIFNFVTSEKYVFSSRKVPGNTIKKERNCSKELKTMFETPNLVSVIIPVKRSQRTIRATVESLLNQDYEGPIEIILVGDRNDPTWEPLQDLIETKKMLRVIEVNTANFQGRDSNIKRNIGLEAAQGRWLALTDSDMVMPKFWVRRGLQLMRERDIDCVAGPMISIDGRSSFWGAYVDLNVWGSKTPRVADEYIVNASNFGMGVHKPAVTANVLFSRQLYKSVGGLDPDFIFTYDDYEWFWRIAKSGYDTLYTPVLAAEHHHRHGLNKLSREYYESGRGCAHLIWKHIACPLCVMRLVQFFAILLLIVLAVLYPLQIIPGVIAGLSLLGILTIVKTRRIEGFAFPFITFALGLSFCQGMGYGLIRGLENLNPLDEIVQSKTEMPQAR
jgi:putative flippase GtrA/GT2 family glycosyltransferase